MSAFIPSGLELCFFISLGDIDAKLRQKVAVQRYSIKIFF